MKKIFGMVLWMVVPLSLWALKPGDFVTHGPTTAKVVALSFDDGPGPFTPQVLDILKENGIHATFFMLGEQVRFFTPYAKRVRDEGHEIGNHTYSHDNFYTYKASDPVTKLKAQIELSRQVIHDATGVTTTLCRMPYGYNKPWARRLLGKEGFTIVNWTFGCDWIKETLMYKGIKMTPEGKRLAYIKAIHPGAIFLMHDGGIKRESTIYALKGLVAELKKQGYQIVPVGELIGVKD
jgi:peptidoglycan/xylan/chitin deacetylase (PgdA/CDA1 family)